MLIEDIYSASNKE